MFPARWSWALTVWMILRCAAWAQMPDWQRGVAKVTVNAGLKRDPGTAFVVSVSGSVAYLVTSAHVVAGDDRPEVRFAVDPERPFPSSIYKLNAADEEHGLAVLRVAGPPAQVRPLPPAKLPQIGQRVLIAGFPKPEGELSVLDPVISRYDGLDLVLSQQPGEGYSGGPVIHESAVVGIYFGRSGSGKAAKVSYIDLYLRENRIDWNAVPSVSSWIRPSQISTSEEIGGPMTIAELIGVWSVKPGYTNGEVITFENQGGVLSGRIQVKDPCRNLTLSFALENVKFTPAEVSFSYTLVEKAHQWRCQGESFTRPYVDVTERLSYRGAIQRKEPYKGSLLLNPRDASILSLYKQPAQLLPGTPGNRSIGPFPKEP